MICYHLFGSIKAVNALGQLYTSPIQTWIFPAVFAVTPPRILGSASNYALFSGGTNALSTGSFNLMSPDINRVGGVQIFAIGRWK